MKKLTRSLLLAVLAIACFLAVVSCSEEEVHTCTSFDYRWKNIDGTNTYQKVCMECGMAENLNPTKALLIEGEDFATAVYEATNESYDSICTIEFKGNCTKPEGLDPELVVSVDTSEYEAWIDWNLETRTITIMTDADVFMLNELSYSMFDNDYLNASYSLEEIKFNHLVDTSAVTTFEYFLYECYALRSMDFSDFDTSSAENMCSMFHDCHKLRSLDLSGFDTSNVTDMCYMFYGCTGLESVDLSSFDTSNVTTMEEMFGNCEVLEELDLSSFDTSSVTNMYEMFYECYRLEKLDISSFDTSNVETMEYMFAECKSLESIDLSGFVTTNLEYAYSMFYDCESLRELDLSSFDTSKVTDMSYMFSQCHLLRNLDLSTFSTSEVTRTIAMFDGCYLLEQLDISSFDTSEVTDMSQMFRDCYQLTDIKLGPGFSMENVDDNTEMFDGLTDSASAALKPGDSVAVISGIPATQIDSLLDAVDYFTPFDCTWSKSDDKIVLTKNMPLPL